MQNNLLGETQYQAKRYLDASISFASAIASDATNPIFHRNYAAALFMQGMYGEAAKGYIKAAELDPNNSTYLSNAGWCFYQGKDYPSACSHLERACALASDVASYRSDLGAIYLALGDFARARACCETAYKLANNPMYMTNLEYVNQREEAALYARFGEQILASVLNDSDYRENDRSNSK
ncbi:MAG: tetratricopeptide repeat protein [Rickettsiales bacterium]